MNCYCRLQLYRWELCRNGQDMQQFHADDCCDNPGTGNFAECCMLLNFRSPYPRSICISLVGLCISLTSRPVASIPKHRDVDSPLFALTYRTYVFVLNFIVFFHILLYVCAFATFSLKAT